MTGLPRVARILAVLAASAGSLTAQQIAETLNDKSKPVYVALQDLRRRSGLVDGPENGRWVVTPEGRANLAARRRKEETASA